MHGERSPSLGRLWLSARSDICLLCSGRQRRGLGLQHISFCLAFYSLTSLFSTLELSLYLGVELADLSWSLAFRSARSAAKDHPTTCQQFRCEIHELETSGLLLQHAPPPVSVRARLPAAPRCGSWGRLHRVELRDRLFEKRTSSRSQANPPQSCRLHEFAGSRGPRITP